MRLATTNHDAGVTLLKWRELNPQLPVAAMNPHHVNRARLGADEYLAAVERREPLILNSQPAVADSIANRSFSSHAAGAIHSRYRVTEEI